MLLKIAQSNSQHIKNKVRVGSGEVVCTVAQAHLQSQHFSIMATHEQILRKVITLTISYEAALVSAIKYT